MSNHPPIKPPTTTKGVWAKRAVLGLGIATAGFFAFDKFIYEDTVTRNLRVFRAAAEIVVDYKLRYDPEVRIYIQYNSVRYVIHRRLLAKYSLYRR